MLRQHRQETDIVGDLANLLRKNGDKILSGESKLSLTTQSLSQLNSAFRRYSDLSHDQSGETTSGNRRLQDWRRNAQFLHDFIMRTVSLKLTHGTQTMQGAIFISRFRNLQVLEFKKVPIHMLQGLQKLRGQLKVLIVSRCLQNIQDLLETCGGDMSAPLSWPELSSLFIAYNSLMRLDTSLRLLPKLEALDASHNNLDKTENILQCLTDIERINLGYNSLDSVPSFSLSAKPKIKTLVLRNNHLDNLEGIDELVCLEELDVSENCLVNHSCLQVLEELCKLTLLGLQGNPLSFHRSHRALTLQHISPAAGRNTLILDGKAITPTERLLTQRSGITPSRRPSQEAQSIISGVQRSSILKAYKFEDSDSIATSLKVGSPRGRRKISKKQSKTKVRSVTDEVSNDVSTDFDSSVDLSRDPSPSRLSEEQKSNKEHVQVLRDHYGVNWLQVMNANRLSNVSSSLPTEREMKDKQNTEDDIYMNDSTVGVNDRMQQVSGRVTEQNDTGNVTNGVFTKSDGEDDIEVIASDGEGSTTVIKRQVSEEFYAGDESSTLSREDSSHGVEWKRTDSEQLEFYGAESEPFIVNLPNDDAKELIVSINQRYIIEKDLNGKVTEMLDLKCLEAVSLLHNTATHEAGETTPPSLRMKFDYVRRDRRERVYAMEDEISAENFTSLLQPFIEAKLLDKKLDDLLQCLKCSSHFQKSEAETADISLLQRRTSTVEDADVKYKCPKCGSQMVVKVERQQATPVGSYSSVSSLQMQGGVRTSSGKGLSSSPQSKEILAGSPVAKSTPMKDDKTTLKPEKTIEPDKSMSKSDGFTGLVSVQTSAKHTHLTSDNYVTTPVENKAFHRDNPWSEESTSLTSCQQRASVDSDITILTNTSEGSVAVISESSVETLPDPDKPVTMVTQDSNVFDDKMPLLLSSNPSINIARPEQDISHKKSLNLNGIVEEGETTPLGSPLSTSICSSMVSSVYENSVLAASEENLQTTGKDDFTSLQNVINTKPSAINIDNNNGDIESIYDNHDNNDTNDYNQLINTETNGNTDYVDNITNEFQSVMNLQSNSSPRQQEVNGDSREATLENSMETSVEGERHAFDVFSESVEELDYTKIDHRLSLYLMMSVLEEGEECQCAIKATLENSMETSVEGERHAFDVFSESVEELDYSKIDDRLSLYLMMSVLEEGEECQCAIKCDVVQYMDGSPFDGILVLTTTRIIILKVILNDESEAPEKCLNCIENQPITELHYIDIGLGYQTFRFEFSTECSSFTFIVWDEKRCKSFIALITTIIQGTAFSEHSKLEGITKYNATTLDNLQKVLTLPSDLEEGEIAEDTEAFVLVRYLSCHLVNETDLSEVAVGLAVSDTELCVLEENHQWPLPRLQAPLDDEIKGQQFTLRERQKINNIATVETCEDDHTKLRFTFFSDDSPDETCWQLSFHIVSSVQSLIEAIRDPWESEFGVALDITPASFTDE